MVPWRWAATLGLGLASAVPFAMIGLNIGMRLGSQGATAVANLLFLSFCLFGGLWMPLNMMPNWFAKRRPGDAVLPPGPAVADAVGHAADGQASQQHVLVLVAISIAAMIGAWAAWRRQAA
jgi:ABC-2 type transport system permease protein